VDLIGDTHNQITWESINWDFL